MARNGKLELLKFLRSEGCPWNTYTCTAAAHNGQSSSVEKYAHAKDVVGINILVRLLPIMATSSV